MPSERAQRAERRAQAAGLMPPAKEPQERRRKRDAARLRNDDSMQELQALEALQVECESLRLAQQGLEEENLGLSEEAIELRAAMSRQTGLLNQKIAQIESLSAQLEANSFSHDNSDKALLADVAVQLVKSFSDLKEEHKNLKAEVSRMSRMSHVSHMPRVPPCSPENRALLLSMLGDLVDPNGATNADATRDLCVMLRNMGMKS